MSAVVEVGRFGGRIAHEDTETIRAELCSILSDLGAAVKRFQVLPAPTPLGVAVPIEVETMLAHADQAQRLAYIAARRLMRAFPAEMAAVRAEITAEEAGATETPLTFSRS